MKILVTNDDGIAPIWLAFHSWPCATASIRSSRCVVGARAGSPHMGRSGLRRHPLCRPGGAGGGRGDRRAAG